MPHLWFPSLRTVVLYSEILDKHLKLVVTERTLRLIDACFGLDYYLFETSDVDINSKLGITLKRLLLIGIAKEVHIIDLTSIEFFIFGCQD